MTDPLATRHRATSTALVAAAYLGIALLVYAAVLPAPRTLLPYAAMLDANTFARANFARLDHHDQSMVVATMARNADKLVRTPLDLFGDGQCFPTPRSYTLGEHMFGVSLLSAVPYALSRDPILSFNVALLLTIWIPAMAMYLLSLEFTRLPSAAFLAGLAFALAPPKLVDPTHPYVHGDLWAPLALLFVHRLLTRGGILNALGLALFMSLEVAESLYPLLSTSVYVAVYGLYGLVRHRARARSAAPLLVLSVAIVAVVAWAVLGPYLTTRATWDVLGERSSLLLSLGEFAPGQFHFPGWIVLPLALVGLLDRLRGPRLVAGEDPRLAITAGIAVLLWCVVKEIPIPGTSMALPSLLWMARDWIPGLDAVRALPAVAIGAALGMSFLAGYGALVLTERLGRRAALAVTAVLALAIVLERSHGTLARASFGRLLRITARPARPAEEDIALIKHLPAGAVLDVPLAVGRATQLRNGRYLLLGSYSPRPRAACYNSFTSPIQTQVVDLTARLPEPRAADALAALGFRTVLLHKEDWFAPDFERFQRLTAQKPVIGQRLRPLGQTRQLLAYELHGVGDVTESYDVLVPATVDEPPAIVRPPSQKITFRLRNHGVKVFRHPDPILPTELVVRWAATDADLPEAEWNVRGLLPVALAGGAPGMLVADVPVPDNPGRYRVTVARAAAPDTPIAAREVEVRAVEELPARLAQTRIVEADQLERLSGPVTKQRTARAAGERVKIPFEVTNRTAQAFDPSRSLTDVGFRIEWLTPDGDPVTQTWGRAPLKSLGAKGSASVPVLTTLPTTPGIYVARLRPASNPELLLDEITVHVDASGAPAPVSQAPATIVPAASASQAPGTPAPAAPTPAPQPPASTQAPVPQSPGDASTAAATPSSTPRASAAPDAVPAAVSTPVS